MDETAGKFVRYEGKLCETFYFAADGGATEDSENVWVTAVPYLRGVVDPYEKDIDFYCKSWSTSISRAAVGDVSITYTPIGNAHDGDGRGQDLQQRCRAHVPDERLRSAL